VDDARLTAPEPVAGMRVRVRKPDSRWHGTEGLVVSAYLDEHARSCGWLVWVRFPDAGDKWDGLEVPWCWDELELISEPVR
jgi:hypothetical protein